MRTSVIDPSLRFYATRKVRRHRLLATAAARTHDLRLFFALHSQRPRTTVRPAATQRAALVVRSGFEAISDLRRPSPRPSPYPGGRRERGLCNGLLAARPPVG